MIKILVIAEVPDERGNEWCQHVRDFDVRVAGCKFNLFALAPDKSVDEMKEMLNIKPPLQLRKEIKRG
jgi:hypothetical protein